MLFFRINCNYSCQENRDENLKSARKHQGFSLSEGKTIVSFHLSHVVGTEIVIEKG